MKRTKKADPETQLAETPGPSHVLWTQLVDMASAEFAPLALEWKPAKLEFGSVCLVKQRDRTLIYLIPGKGQFEALHDRLGARRLGVGMLTCGRR